MEKKEVQFLFKEYAEGDSMIQLNNGRILFYYYTGNRDIYVYSDKTFKKLFEIDSKSFIPNYDKDTDKFCYKNNIKLIDNGLILIGYSKYLIEVKLFEKTYDFKIVKQFSDVIIDINELPDKRIIIFTQKNIVILNKENYEYIVKEEYSFKVKWKRYFALLMDDNDEYVDKYYSSYILPDNRILLNLVSRVYRYNTGYVRRIMKCFDSKIMVIDLNNFKVIMSTEIFKECVKHIVLENAIIIHTYENLIIYDINTLKIIQQYKSSSRYNHFHKYDNKYLIGHSNYEQNFNLAIFKFENNELIKYCLIESGLFRIIFTWNLYRISASNPFLFVLRDKKIIIFSSNKMYLLLFRID